jgi:hypothetical protein
MNGIDIMDAMINASTRLQYIAEYRVRCVNLKNRIGKCGSCSKWMKSGQCPHEKNINGMNRGPSMGESVRGCHAFVIDPRHAVEFQKEQQWLDGEKERLGL